MGIKYKNILQIGSLMLLIFVIGASFTLAFHNVSLYEPLHGFDGSGHLYYIKYVYQNWITPSVNLGWETHQSPLYYFLAAAVMKIAGGSWKIAQYMNTFVMWMTIGMAGVGFWKLFKNRNQVFIGIFALAALPMLNIFPPMLGNEMLSTFWIISALVTLIFLVQETVFKRQIYYVLLFMVCFILGYWTKVSIITIIPVTIVAGVMVFFKNAKQRVKLTLFGLIVGVIMMLAIYPIIQRSQTAIGPSNVARALTTKEYYHGPDFFYRLDWITNLDIHKAQYYSLWGGAWNSFWTDGHNAITPFVPFHKKAFVLWCLGFLLLPLSLYGLYRLGKKNLLNGLLISSAGISLLAIYVYLNLITLHYSAARLTYVMAIIFPYAAGIASASQNRKLQYVILLLLLIQFVVMVSFYWIEPWWHVTR